MVPTGKNLIIFTNLVKHLALSDHIFKHLEVYQILRYTSYCKCSWCLEMWSNSVFVFDITSAVLDVD